MKRFYFGSEDDEDGEDAEAFEAPSHPEFIAMTNVESPFKHLLDCSIRVCEKNFFWRFLSPGNKAQMIRKVFDSLSQLEMEYEDDAEIRDEM